MYLAVPNTSVSGLLSYSGPEQYTLAWNLISIHVGLLISVNIFEGRRICEHFSVIRPGAER